MKKLLALTLCLLMCLSAMGSVAFATEYDPANVSLDGTLPIVKDPSKLEPLTIVIPTPENRIVNENDLPWTKEIFEATGVPIKWIGVPESGYQEKVNLMLASRDLPDMFWKGINASTITQYIGQDVFLPTDELIEKYVPNLVEIFKQRPQYAALSQYADGHRYGFPYVEEMYGLTLTPGPFLINKNWLDQLGLEVPKTLDEFKAALVAFKNGGDLNGNGEADEIPYASNFVIKDIFSTLNSFFTLMSCFGEGVSYGDEYPYCKLGDDGKVEFAVLSDAFKETLHFYNELNQEGLLDMDGFSGEGDYTYKLRLDDAVIGAFSIWSPEGSIPVREVLEQYVPLPRLEGPKGKMGIAVNRSELWGTSQSVLTTACKYPEIAAALMNYLNQPEQAITTNWGTIGWSYTKGEDGVLRFPLDEKGYFILPEGMETFNDVRQNSTPAQGGVTILNEYYDTVAEYTYDAVSLLEFQRVNGKEEVLKEDTPMPPVLMTTEEQAAYSQIQPQIENIVKSYMVSSILDGGIDENYDTFVGDLKSAGLDEMIKLIQGAYDRYLVTYQEYAAK